MGPVARGVAVIVAALLLATGCSGDDPSPSGAATPASPTGEPSAPAASGPEPPAESTTSAPVQAATSTIPPGAAPVNTSAATIASTATTTSPATTAPGTQNSSSATGPLVAASGGWRLAVTQPRAGATIGPVVTLCYEVTGTTREPVVVLEATLLRPGTTSGAEAVQVDGSVGRGSVRVDLGGSTPGSYDLRVQMIVNGERLGGGSVTIPMVTLTGGTPPAVCS